MDDLLGDFLTETGESLDLLDSELVRFEREPNNAEMLNAIFRLVHTVKGTCGFLGLPRLAKLAHAAETLMGQYRDGAPVTAAGVTLILESIDRIKQILAELERRGTEPQGSDTELIEALEGLAEARPRAPAIEEAPSGEEGQPDRNTGDSVGARAQTVRVNVDTLEHLMTTVSELVLTRNQLLELVRRNGENAFKAPLQRLSSVTADLQDGIMQARLQPIANAWQQLPRLVRELSRGLGKLIELDLRGGDTELDRQVLELIKDPLTHMVRNSAGHGIESAGERIARGKPPAGRIGLSARQQGGYILIEVADDGRGLDARKIRDKAVASGFATQADIDRLSDAEVFRFIFKPGFSTAEAVTGVSGRGVGMDVVRNNIEKIGGSVELKTTSPEGSVFVIKIPLTLAIMSALIVEAGGQRFAIPQFSVVELVRAGPSSEHRIERINETCLLRLRDKLLPLLDLAKLLELEWADGDSKPRVGARTVVVMQVGTKRFGVAVDAVFHAEEIVVKPLASLLRDVEIFSGNTILGDGSVIMIVDPNALAGFAGTVGAGEDGGSDRAPVPEVTPAGTMPLLLFEAGSKASKAVPLSLITRLEEFERAAIERCNGADVVQYRGRLMPLVYFEDSKESCEAGLQPVLVFTEDGRAVGLAVDRIVDIVEDRLNIEIGPGRPGIVGSAIVNGKAAEIVDVSHYLAKGAGQRAPAAEDPVPPATRLLLLDDSQFFRDMLTPLLAADGYQVTAAGSAAEAKSLMDQGKAFDVIVGDLDLPGLDGITLPERVACSSSHAVPLIGLSSQTRPHLDDRARAAGFVDVVGKFDRQRLLERLRAFCKPWSRVA